MQAVERQEQIGRYSANTFIHFLAGPSDSELYTVNILVQAGHGAIGQCRLVAGKPSRRRHSLLPIPRGHGGIYTRREGWVNV